VAVAENDERLALEPFITDPKKYLFLTLFIENKFYSHSFDNITIKINGEISF
jgi:hypothetical protein